MYLEQLSNAFGVSSVEDDVRKIIIEAAQPHANNCRVDSMGNLFITRKCRAKEITAPLKIMIAAHMDEVGFMISKITSKGLLKFKAVGGFDRRVLLGKSVVVGKERLHGVIGLKPIHLLKRNKRNIVDEIDSMYIDIGATDDTAYGKVKVGDFATFATKYSHLGGQTSHNNDKGLVKGKAFDDRAGCAVILELLKGDYPVDLTAVFTVQEEIGLRGAKVAAYAANPDLAFIMESTAADDTPPEDEDEERDYPAGIPRLGGGSAITVMDRSFIADRRLVDLLVSTAEAEGLPHQFKRPGIGGTDAGAIHLSREGVPSVVVSVPARYIHSPAAIIDLTDFWNTVKLMQAVFQHLPKQDWRR